MLHKISKLNGVKTLKKEQQNVINGGSGLTLTCHSNSDCPPGYICVGCYCRLPGDYV